MFKLIYAGSVLKDLRKVSPDQLPKIKNSVAELDFFPNFSQKFLLINSLKLKTLLRNWRIFRISPKLKSGFVSSKRMINSKIKVFKVELFCLLDYLT